MRILELLETKSVLIPDTSTGVGNETRAEEGYDYVPFMEKGVPFLHVLPTCSLPSDDTGNGVEDAIEELDLPTVRDWSKIMVGFSLEWLDMMEVWPE